MTTTNTLATMAATQATKTTAMATMTTSATTAITSTALVRKQQEDSTSSDDSVRDNEQSPVVTSSESESCRPAKRLKTESGTLAKRQKPESLAYLDHDTTSDDEDFNTPACKWKDTQLDALHVFYAETPSSPAEIFEKLKLFSHVEQKATVTSAVKFFSNLLRERLIFSVDLQSFMDYLAEIMHNASIVFLAESDYESRQEVEAKFEEVISFEKDLIKSFANDFAKIFSSSVIPDIFEEFEFPAADYNLIKSIFPVWSTRVRDFVRETRRMLNMYIDHPTEQRLKGQIPSDAVFTSLVRLFAEMHFLIPERLGRKKNLKVRGHIVAVVPDVHYFVQSDDGSHRHKVVVIIEVRSAAHQKTLSENSTIQDLLSRDVLGQIGLELITERIVSHFNPIVFGIVCIRTEIIFMILEMSREHFSNIGYSQEIDEKFHSTILYSRPFDILKQSDQNDISELLFYVGAQQCGDLSNVC